MAGKADMPIRRSIMPLIHLLFAAVFLAAAEGQSLSRFGRARVRLSEGVNGTVELRINESRATAISALARSRRPLVCDGATVVASEETIRIEASSDPVLVLGAPKERWQLEIPAHNAAEFRIDLQWGRVVLGAPDANSAGCELVLFDKGRAELKPAGSAQLEFFDDETYSLAASTNVTAVSSDGLKINFSSLQPPMLGGELKEHHAGGASRFVRATPAVTMEFLGSPAGEVRVRTEERELALIADQDRQFEFRNGSKLFVKYVSARQAVEWRIIKGVIYLKLPGFSCWKGIVRSGQAGSLQWNPAKKIVDFANSSGTPIIAQLSGRLMASVSPGARFQYAQLQDCGSFVTSATGAEVFLTDRESGEVTPVLEKNVAFSEGERVNARAVERVFVPLSFGWVSDSRVQIRAESGAVAIDGGEEQVLRANGNELLVSYAKNGDLTLRAGKGHYTLKPSFIPNFELEIPESGVLVLGLDPKRLKFTARAADETGASIRAVAAGQTYMFLTPPAKITVNVGQNSFLPESSVAWIFFEGAGGESSFVSGTQPGPQVRPDRLDVSRISQEPVSVIE